MNGWVLAVSAVFTCLLLVIYKYVVNPQIVLTADHNMSICPDRWNYNSSTKMCDPAYQTSCLPFNPKASTLSSVTARCNVAHTCGTSWGMC